MGDIPQEPMNTKVRTWEKNLEIDQTMNHLWDDSEKKCGGYEDEEELVEFDSADCY